ncbi:zinc ribbon domain-containing protein [Micromonospora sp. 4G57]|uniref:Zinc ribbon domain-containing protein n=1 Tax=Micromonospora sicca TaxID=2202420 RepID=A0ABU5JDW6_9ACTN|nr:MULTISPECIES: zinc ribbon domain-containing protein [unclassified Micromonospora]MDZ5445109.1 zinc ribbon domain-containing protein [Micromonospora sp. 4G57]MDZ5490772.1 zinc ribbon domain-containing protein [Micromonospora sp. 4G53]
MADEVIAAHWSDGDRAVLAGGVGADGRRLPASGWMALRRLGWGAVSPAGVVVSDRVRRIAEEEAARALRLGCHRRAVVAALLATWPADPFARTEGEWSALRAVLSEGCDNATIRNRTRQIAGYIGRHARLPAGLCELEGPPAVARQVSLAAADRQQVVVDRVDGRMVRVWSQLPVCAAPVSYRDWVWHAFDVVLPAIVPAWVKVCTPTLRPGDGKVRVDLPWQTPHTPPPLDGHTRALGVDWGVNTLLTATVADLDRDGCVAVRGRPLRFDATGVSAKLVRLRRHREHLKTKADHVTWLRDGRPADVPADPALTGKLVRLEAEHTAVCARIRHLNKALAWSAARWLVDHATAVGATVIYVENLATLEAGGGSRSLNRRLSGAVRGAVFTAIAHLAAKAGIAVVTVPARGTSSGCPRCGRAIKHVKTPERSAAGYRWATCSCGLSMDRDHAASQRIAARGLANQTKTLRDRNGNAAIRTATDTPVRHRARRPTRAATVGPQRDRRKTLPTPKQTRPATVKASRLLPLRRQVPAPAGSPPGSAGKRPAGRTPQETNPPGPVRQVPHTISTTTQRHPHRVRGAVLGRGFHRHVHATPITDRDARTGETSASLRIT